MSSCPAPIEIATTSAPNHLLARGSSSARAHSQAGVDRRPRFPPEWRESQPPPPGNISSSLSFCVFLLRTGRLLFPAANQVHRPRHQILNDGSVQPIPNLLAIAAAGNQVRIFEHG